MVMGVDWRSIGWREYQVRLAGWNENHREKKGEPTGEPDFERLKVHMAAHSVH